jgi:toxin ParE1/3/4
MRVVYSKRALADLEQIANYYVAHASHTISESIRHQLLSVIGRIARNPDSAPRVSQRTQVRAATIIRYPFRIFYRVNDERIDILHIRHTSRRPSEM